LVKQNLISGKENSFFFLQEYPQLVWGQPFLYQMQQDTHHSPLSSAQVKNTWIKFLETELGKQLWTQ